MLWLIERQLKSKKAASRRKAVECHCEAPQPPALEVLRKALNDEGVTCRSAVSAVSALV
jgi:hypothetical protein